MGRWVDGCGAASSSSSGPGALYVCVASSGAAQWPLCGYPWLCVKGGFLAGCQQNCTLLSSDTAAHSLPAGYYRSPMPVFAVCTCVLLSVTLAGADSLSRAVRFGQDTAPALLRPSAPLSFCCYVARTTESDRQPLFASVLSLSQRHAVLCCAVLCCAVLCCAVLCCAVLCCADWLCWPIALVQTRTGWSIFISPSSPVHCGAPVSACCAACPSLSLCIPESSRLSSSAILLSSPTRVAFTVHVPSIVILQSSAPGCRYLSRWRALLSLAFLVFRLLLLSLLLLLLLLLR